MDAGWISQMLKATLPAGARRWLRSQKNLFRRARPFGRTRGELLEQTKPVSARFGLDRGLPIDRYYIDQFLSAHQSDICGHVLEVEDDLYATRFGGGRVRHLDILHVQPGNSRATIIADLSAENSIPSETFDCIILTQTLQFIYDVHATVRNVHRILKPGGVVLATVPGISQISRYDMDRWNDYWRFTTASVERLFSSVFPESHLEIRAYGNALVASAFLHGLAAEELLEDELRYADPDYEMLITLRGKRA
jgi:SAM-dependent methyltransferase